MFYRLNGQLRARFGDDPPIDIERFEVTWAAKNGAAHFMVRRQGRPVLERSYRLSADVEGIEDDPTPFVEAEDFDFLLFITNVVRDLARAKAIYPNGR
jgi:hypothetical protein